MERFRSTTAIPTWTHRIFAALGIVSLLPWALWSALSLAERNAPDGTARSQIGMLVVQVALIAIFVSAFWPRPGVRLALVLGLVAYAVVAGLGAADNGGSPILAAILFPAPTALAASPIILLRVAGRQAGHAEAAGPQTA